MARKPKKPKPLAPRLHRLAAMATELHDLIGQEATLRRAPGVSERLRADKLANEHGKVLAKLRRGLDLLGPEAVALDAAEAKRSANAAAAGGAGGAKTAARRAAGQIPPPRGSPRLNWSQEISALLASPYWMEFVTFVSTEGPTDAREARASENLRAQFRPILEAAVEAHGIKFDTLRRYLRQERQRRKKGDDEA